MAMTKFERARYLVALEEQLKVMYSEKATEMLSGFTFNEDEPIEVKQFVRGMRKLVVNALARRGVEVDTENK